MQPAPAAFGFGEDTRVECEEQLQSPVSVTALPLPVLSVGIWARHALLARINCADSCCVQTNISQGARPYVPAASMLPCLRAYRMFYI